MTTAGNGATGMVMPKISYASTMIVEDHLKKLLTSNTAKPFRAYHNQLLPRFKHSPFGDFPADKMPAKRGERKMEPPSIEQHEMSVSAKAIRKLIDFSRKFKIVLGEFFLFQTEFSSFNLNFIFVSNNLSQII